MDTAVKTGASADSHDCLIDQTLTVIAGKWKIGITWLLLDGDRRFNDLRRSLPGVTQKMLTQQLRELEADGLVRREVFAVVPPKVVYSLTPLGQTLRPLLDIMGRWAQEHGEEVKSARLLLTPRCDERSLPHTSE